MTWLEFQGNMDPENTSKFFIPQHLHIPQPSNTPLWRMRKAHEAFSAGYSPFSGDFRTEFDNNAEYLVCLAGELNRCGMEKEENSELDNEEKRLLEDLQVTLVDCYNLRLKERLKRKSIIKEYGLMNSNGTKSWYTKLEITHGRHHAKKLVRLCRILKVGEAEHLFSLLEILNKKRAEMNKLIHSRSHHGITCLRGITIYEGERKRRELSSERVDVRKIIAPPAVKRKQTYTKIFHLPRFKDLSNAEAELCSCLNIRPEFFLHTKDTLIADCKKQSGMLLKRARQLVKIDVNKTRKIFDLLMENGLIWPPVADEKSQPKGRPGRKAKKKGPATFKHYG